MGSSEATDCVDAIGRSDATGPGDAMDFGGAMACNDAMVCGVPWAAGPPGLRRCHGLRRCGIAANAATQARGGRGNEGRAVSKEGHSSTVVRQKGGDASSAATG